MALKTTLFDNAFASNNPMTAAVLKFHQEFYATLKRLRTDLQATDDELLSYLCKIRRVDMTKTRLRWLMLGCENLEG